MEYQEKRDKVVRITYEGESLSFKLQVKRAYTVLKEILDRYPEKMNIHELDGVLNDPNRALSSLRHEDGFKEFLYESKDRNRVVHVTIDLDKLFSQYKGWSSDKPIELSPGGRGSLSKSEKEKIIERQNGRCNITGIKLDFEEGGRKFMNRLLKPAFDHRIPLFKGGTNDIENWQLISNYCNREKNNICNVCDLPEENCKKCALAYPEEHKTIQFNDQNIEKLKKEVEDLKE